MRQIAARLPKNTKTSVALAAALTMCAALGQSAGTKSATDMRHQVLSVSITHTERVNLSSLVVLPKNYEADRTKKWPIILYLHGAGERGTDLSQLMKTPAVQAAEQGDDYPFILIAPQEPSEDQSWNYPGNAAAVMSLLDKSLSQLRADPARVYLTGPSMGGWGTWFIAHSFPTRFAAIAPLCGLDPNTSWAASLVGLPVWAFHGTDDTVADPKRTERMVNAIQTLGGEAKLTLLAHGNHEIAAEVYKRKDLYQWFLSHER